MQSNDRVTLSGNVIIQVSKYLSVKPGASVTCTIDGDPEVAVQELEVKLRGLLFRSLLVELHVLAGCESALGARYPDAETLRDVDALADFCEEEINNVTPRQKREGPKDEGPGKSPGKSPKKGPRKS